ncbi:protein YgfX [Halomonas sp. Bachu 37]|uniref:hypothetical protein n=1 Tax=Halomonas kashgarensis TaxID=3084920 RepID=UPI003217D612
MPKPPIILHIVPSRVAVALHLSLAFGITALYGWLGSVMVALGVLLLCLAAIAWVQRSQPCGTLWLSEKGAELQSYWELQHGGLGPACRVRCRYLGPWLIGLDVAQQGLWLWPDSASASERRELRRLLRYSTDAKS